MESDEEVSRQLVSVGWKVAIVWECALRKPDQIPVAAENVFSWLKSEKSLLELGAENRTSPNA